MYCSPTLPEEKICANLLTDAAFCVILVHVVRTMAYVAGWSSLAARRAHNPKVVGSNPTPATIWRHSSAGQSIRFIPEVSCVRITLPLPMKRPGFYPGFLFFYISFFRHRSPCNGICKPLAAMPRAASPVRLAHSMHA